MRTHRIGTWIAGLMLLAFAGLGSGPAAAADDEDDEDTFEGEILAPPLVGAGESFEATVVRWTDDGAKPLAGGESLRYGRLTLSADAKGKFVFPPIERTGNHFLGEDVSLPKTKERMVGRPPHVEVVEVARDLPPRILHVSHILRAGGTVTALGQHLDRYQPGARLEDREGRKIDLGAPVFRSSLAVRWNLPKDLPHGPWLLEMFEGRAHPVRAPEESVSPAIEAWGAGVKEPGEMGTFSVRSDVDVTVRIWGGLPTVAIRESRVDLVAGRTAQIHFVQVQRDLFRAKVEAESLLDDPPPEGSPGVDARSLPVETRYDRRANDTIVRAPTMLVDADGRPLAGRQVGVLLTQPGGLEFQKLTTDDRGIAILQTTLPGVVPAEAIHAHLWAARGTQWRKQDAKDEKKPEEPKKKKCDCKGTTFDIPADTFKFDYDPGKKADKITWSCRFKGTATTEGAGDVVVRLTGLSVLSAYKGDSKAIQEYEDAVDAAQKARAADQADAADLEAKAKALETALAKKRFGRGRKGQESLQETVPCDPETKKSDWEREVRGDIKIDDDAYRVGPATKQPRAYWLGLRVSVGCGEEDPLEYVFWILADVGWKNNAPDVTRVHVKFQPF